MNVNLPETYHVLSKFEACLRVEDVLRVTLRAASRFGVEFVLVGTLPERNLSPADQREHVIFGSIPGEWGERYFRRNYLELDPTIHHIRHRDGLLRWTGVRSPVMDEAWDFGLKEGITIPHLSLDGVRIGASFSGHQMDLSAGACTYLNVLSAMALMRTFSLSKTDCSDPLSPRERECLLWAADGKSDWDISAILGISQKTVEKHLSNCRRKLNAVNRCQAVVRALRFGIIG